MKKITVGLLGALLLCAFSGFARAGDLTANQFFYKPNVGARGTLEKDSFTAGLERVDARLGKEIWVGDPKFGVTVQSAVTAVGSNTAMLRVPAGTHNITADLTIPGNIVIKPERGAVFAIADGKTLTINGGLEAGPYQIFSCTGAGKAAFGKGSIKQVHAEWWGARADGTTECRAALAAACATEIPVQLLDGTYKLTNGTIYLTSTTYDLQYVLRGQGRSTKLALYGFNSGTYLFKVNEDSGGNPPVYIPRHPRLIVEKVQVDGTNSTNACFALAQVAGVALRDVQFNQMYIGVANHGYNDMVTLENVDWSSGRAGGWTFKGEWLGDGFLAQSCFEARILLRGCKGGNILSQIGGFIQLEGCTSINIEGCHTEGVETPITDSLIKIKSSMVSIKNSFLENSNGNIVPIIVDDSADLAESHVVLDSNVFFTLIAAADSKRNADIHIIPSGRTVVDFRNNKTQVQGTPDLLGILASSTNTYLNAALTTRSHLLSGYATIRNLDWNSWEVVPLSGIRELSYVSDPTLLPYAQDGSGHPFSNLVSGTTYYYKMAYFTDTGSTLASSEVNITPSGSNMVVLLQSYGAHTDSQMMRLWRGTASGVYDHYVDIPVIAQWNEVRDRGTYIDGFAWIATNIPALPTANTTMSGYLAQGKRVFFAGAAPTSAEFSGWRGDVVWNTSPAAGSAPGWVCVTAGTPGTWKAMANLAP